MCVCVCVCAQVKWEGGPHPQSSVGFSVSDSEVATATDTGLVKGVSVGVAKLRGALQTIMQDTVALLTFAQVHTHKRTP